MATEKSAGSTIIIGVTGASGAIYAQAILRLLDSDKRVKRVYLVASDAGLRLLSTELGVVAADGKKLPSLLTGTSAKKIEFLDRKSVV
jgi:3-polyprenyl-4-hydroxybenzoate decarboxylase